MARQRHHYRFTLDGITLTTWADSAAQVRRVYPAATGVTRLDRAERTERTAWNIHSGRSPF